jgi:hypothetical protein
LRTPLSRARADGQTGKRGVVVAAHANASKLRTPGWSQLPNVASRTLASRNRCDSAASIANLRKVCKGRWPRESSDSEPSSFGWYDGAGLGGDGPLHALSHSAAFLMTSCQKRKGVAW